MSVREEIKGAVAIVTIDRPEVRNSIDGPTAQVMNEIWDRLEVDDRVNAVVLTGAGDRSFCAGLDLKAVKIESPEMVNQVVLPETGWCGIAQRHFPKPLIAAVNGPALGGGLELALACDLIVAAEGTYFAATEVTLGALPDGGACIRLPHWVPLPLAKEMLFTGAPLEVERAYHAGLVNRIAPAGKAVDVALELAEVIAANPPPSVTSIKRLVHQVLDVPEDQAWPLNNRYLQWSIGTGNFAEGTSAFVEHRSATFHDTEGFDATEGSD